MKLSRYSQFILKESKEDIDSICNKYRINNYTINKYGSIDVNGDVDLYRKELTKFPLKFNEVSGSFFCHENKLVSLEGCPKYVGGEFACSNNQLTSLKYAPEFVGSVLYAHQNYLISLEGFPEFFEGPVYIGNNPVSEILWLFPINIYIIRSYIG